MVYKAHLVRHDAQGGLQTSPVAVKVLKGKSVSSRFKHTTM